MLIHSSHCFACRKAGVILGIAIDIAHTIAIRMDTQKQNGHDLHRARSGF